MILYALLSKENIRFASMPALYTLIMKGSLCSLRAITKLDHGFISFFSGFVAGAASLTMIRKKGRSVWGVFLLARACDIIYTSLVNRKKIPKFKYD